MRNEKNTTNLKLSEYKFDTSSYVFMKMDVKRDTQTGRLVSVVGKPLSRAVGQK